MELTRDELKIILTSLAGAISDWETSDDPMIEYKELQNRVTFELYGNPPKCEECGALFEEVDKNPKGWNPGYWMHSCDHG